MWRFSRLERLLPSFVEGATQIEKVGVEMSVNAAIETKESDTHGN
jgi:hypothetical protein